MRIVYTHRTQGVGAEGAHILGMIEAFRDSGNEVVLDCLPGCDPSERCADTPPVFPREEPAPEVESARRSRIRSIYRMIADRSPQSVFGMVELLYNAPLCFRLWGKLRKRPDLVYERYSVGNFAPASLCRAMGIPLVVEVNDSVVIERSRSTTFARLKRAIESQVLSSADLIVTVTQRFKAELLVAYPRLPESKILVLPNAVSERRFIVNAAKRSDVDLRSRLGLGTRTLLGTAGQFLPWHGITSLISTTADLVRQEDLGFLFIGDGPVRPEVVAASRAAGVEDRVTFTGMVPHDAVPGLLSLLDVAVIPSSNRHCSPMKLVEFMAMGLPVVAPDLPNIREVLEDGRTGRLFQPGDMDDMRRCLAELLGDLAGARAMGGRAREHVSTCLTWSGHARKVLAAVGMRRTAVESELCIS